MASKTKVWTVEDRKRLQGELAECTKYLQEVGEVKQRKVTRAKFTLMGTSVETGELEKLGEVIGEAAKKQLAEVLRPQLEDRYTDCHWVVNRSEAL